VTRRPKTAAAVLAAAIAAAGCGGSSSHSSTTHTVPSGKSAAASLAGCMLDWNSRAPAAARGRLSAGSRPLHDDAAVEHWPAGSVTAATVSGSTVAVSNGDCVIANTRGVAFVNHGGTWTEVHASSPSDSLYRVVSDAHTLPNATYSSQGLLASASEPGP